MASPDTRPQLPEPSISIEDIFAEIQADLETVEQIIRDKVDSKLELVESSSRYIYRGGGKRVRPALVLLAYVSASLLGMLPIPPGGLGFVEAGLTATLALAGVGAADALVATLAYRLVSFWLPLPFGAVAVPLHRRRLRNLSPEDDAVPVR